MPVYDPTSSILIGGVVDIDGLIAALKDKLAIKAASVFKDVIGSPITTTSSSYATITDGVTPASITLAFDSAGDEVGVIVCRAKCSSSVAADIAEFGLYNGSSTLASERQRCEGAIASFKGYSHNVNFVYPIIGGLSGSVTYSLQMKRTSGTGTVECGYYSISGFIFKYR